MDAPRRYGLLLVAAFLSLAVQGVVPPSGVQQVFVTLLAGTMLFLAFRAAEMSPRLVRLAAVLAVAAVLMAIVRQIGGDAGEGASRTINAVLCALGPPAVAVGIVRELRTAGRVRIQAVMGVLALYLLIGMVFGFIYGGIDRFGGDPFFSTGQPTTVSNCLYFSFTTLTTVGYGDFAARSDLGHTLAIMEALLGQIYLVTVVSVIVSNLGRPRPARQHQD
jgi:hypothetical protein